MDQPDEFRPRSSFVYAGLAWTLLGGLLWADFSTSFGEATASSALLATGLGYAVYLLFLRPRVRFFDGGVEIRNPLSHHVIGWQDVQSIDSKFTMSVRVNGHTIHAWAAPAQGRYHSRTLHPSDVKHLRIREGETISAGDLPRAHSGVASHMARLRYGRFDGRATITTRHQRNYMQAALPLMLILLSNVL